MLKLFLNKTVTVIKEMKNSSIVTTIKYAELNNLLSNENKIIVNYCFGQLKNRRRYLEKLGFSLKEAIFFNTEFPYSSIKEIWIKN